MKSISYTIKMLSDAELGSGQGNEGINDLLARDENGNPVLRGSHLKGLLRAKFSFIFGNLEIYEDKIKDLEGLLFGREENNAGSSVFRIPDAKLKSPEDVKTLLITRTALEDVGTAKENSLRTTEALSSGAIFEGVISLIPGKTVDEKLLMNTLELLLLSLDSIGGGRNRGSGACCVKLEGSQSASSSAAVFDQILAVLPNFQWEDEVPEYDSSTRFDTPPAMQWVRLCFDASEPVCCPETPVYGSNVIQSGISIPASAVFGALISLIDREDSALATRSLLHSKSRAWPLTPLPCSEVSDHVFPVRVPLSHKLSKLPQEDGSFDFADATIEPYDWKERLGKPPLKGSDGVLFMHGNEVNLWKSGDMPRLLTSHSVHYPERTLFTVEAMAPTRFVGLAHLPSEAISKANKALEACKGMVSFGKARGIRGGGNLSIEPIQDVKKLFQQGEGWRTDVWVLQSPVAIPDDWDMDHVRLEDKMDELLRGSGWPGLKKVTASPHDEMQIRTQLSCGVRFGWNRHASEGVVDTSRRLRARRVFLPGSVFVLEEAVSEPYEFLIRGIGLSDAEGDSDGREQGFGAALPHPGKALKLYQQVSPIKKLKSSRSATLAWDLYSRTRAAAPSPSQISALAERIPNEGGRDKAKSYLEDQRKRAPRIWEKWETVYSSIIGLLDDTAITNTELLHALRAWRDMSIVSRNEKEKNV